MLKVLPVMHAKPHAVTWLCELLYRKLSTVEFWPNPLIPGTRQRYTAEEKPLRKAAETRVKHFMKDNLGIHVFNPNTQATGKMFKIFATDESRLKVASLIEDEEVRQSFMDIHLMLCALIRVANSQRSLIDVDFYNDVATTCYLQIVRDFEWAYVSESIHQVLAHAGDLIEENEGLGLGDGSEEGGERLVKEVRYWEKHGARKDSISHNVLDTYNHMIGYTSVLLHPVDEAVNRFKRSKKAIPRGGDEIDSLVRMLFLDGEVEKE